MEKKITRKISELITFLIMAHIVLKNLYYINLNGITTNYIINIFGAIIIYLFIQIEIIEKDIKKIEKQIDRKRQAKINKINTEITTQDNYINKQYIDIIHNQVEKQDKYINKQIVTRQYREQKAKKDGK